MWAATVDSMIVCVTVADRGHAVSRPQRQGHWFGPHGLRKSSCVRGLIYEGACGPGLKVFARVLHDGLSFLDRSNASSASV